MATTHQQEVKEWHFHVYFWATTNYFTGEPHRNVAEAEALRDKLIAQVASDPSFVAVCNGISSEQVPGLIGQPPPMNLKPVGPHPQGSFETWVPIESFARVLSWFTLNRGSLSVLVHPLTRHEKKDHSIHAMWLGDAWVIDLDTLRDDLAEPPAQYPELGLGYNRK